MTSDYETWQRGKVISNVLNSVSLESLNTTEGDERTPTPPPSPGTLPNCHAKQPAITAQAKSLEERSNARRVVRLVEK